MTESDFPVTVRDGLAIVTTPAEIDIGNAGLLRAALQEAADTRLPLTVVDLTSTEFCDSTGLSVLVRALRQAEDDGTKLRLVLGGPAVRRILTVTGVAGLFQIFDSLEQAAKTD